MKLIFTTLICLFSLLAFSQGPFNCTSEAYLFQYNDVFAINLASGQAIPIGIDITTGNINATAYNPTDGYIWGRITEPSNSVVRIGADLSTDIYTIPSYRSAYIGAISDQGIFYSKAGGTSYDIVDLNPSSATYLTVLQQNDLSESISIADWAINAADGLLYTVSSKTNILYRIDPTSGTVTALGEVPVIQGFTYTYGAVYFDVDGNFYISANQTGSIYMISAVQNIAVNAAITSTLFAYGPASASNDGARCPTAPVPQEICGNGVDDDGDGLVDCDDPSCSEYIDCAPQGTSGGNNGGLESNNRLSQAIGKRNYNRTKTPTTATIGRALTHMGAKTAQPLKSGALKLSDLIPVGILDETNAFESTPSDLIGITNATEVYAVDYFDEDRTLASVLALKTKGGVYEHSKFICDRLLGAELHSVSSIYINDQSIIRSIIYRETGEREFVLSFSARQTTEGFVIESHWNLDKYTVDEDYYNFQIWTSNIDDLVKLSNGIIDLIAVQENITEYMTSDAPYVFVQRAMYHNGQLELSVMNNNFSTEMTIEGGMRKTETMSTEDFNETVALQPYLNKLVLGIDNIFDLGFRISTDKAGTPDDLFISDGQWGYDDAATGTSILDFEVSETRVTEPTDGYLIERGVHLSARSNDYVAAYRALTPRFEAVDFDAYNTFSLAASGKGELEITLVKESINQWEDQMHVTIKLSEDEESYVINRDDFVNKSGETFAWNDIKLIVATMRSEDGSMQDLEFSLYDMTFIYQALTSVQDKWIDASGWHVSPNPAISTTTLSFEATSLYIGTISIVNALGEKVINEVRNITVGNNVISINVAQLYSGKYYIMMPMESGHTINKELIIVR